MHEEAIEINPALKLVLRCMGMYKLQHRSKRITSNRNFRIQQKVEEERAYLRRQEQRSADEKKLADITRGITYESDVRRWKKKQEREYMRWFSRTELLVVGHREQFFEFLLTDAFLKRKVGLQMDAWLEKQAQLAHEVWLEEIKRWYQEAWLKHTNLRLDTEPRYLEGFPVRDVLGQAIVRSRGRDEEHEVDAYSAKMGMMCLQCSVRHLPCSLVSNSPIEGNRSSSPPAHHASRGGACSRCVRHGDKHECLIATSVDRESRRATSWALADPPSELLPAGGEDETALLLEAANGVKTKWEAARDKLFVDVVGSKTVVLTRSPFAFAPPTPKPLRPPADAESGKTEDEEERKKEPIVNPW
jgi:hypothetical protein